MNKNQFQSILNKGIATPVALLIVFLVAVIAGAGVLAYQHFQITEKEVEVPEEITTPDEKAEKPYIKVISPNGGETWTAGETYTIKWDCPYEVEVNVVDIFIKDKRTGVESPIGDLIECSLEEYSWQIRDNISVGENNFKIQLRYIAGSQPVIDESDNYFTIKK